MRRLLSIAALLITIGLASIALRPRPRDFESLKSGDALLIEPVGASDDHSCQPVRINGFGDQLFFLIEDVGVKDKLKVTQPPQ